MLRVKWMLQVTGMSPKQEIEVTVQFKQDEGAPLQLNELSNNDNNKATIKVGQDFSEGWMQTKSNLLDKKKSLPDRVWWLSFQSITLNGDWFSLRLPQMARFP